MTSSRNCDACKSGRGQTFFNFYEKKGCNNRNCIDHNTIWWSRAVYDWFKSYDFPFRTHKRLFMTPFSPASQHFFGSEMKRSLALFCSGNPVLIIPLLSTLQRHAADGARRRDSWSRGENGDVQHNTASTRKFHHYSDINVNKHNCFFVDLMSSCFCTVRYDKNVQFLRCISFLTRMGHSPRAPQPQQRRHSSVG